MQISVVIVTTNSRQYIGACLDSIREQTEGVDYEVIVADNASTDGTTNLIKKKYPWVTLVENPANLGFGTANNRGAEKATGEYLFFLNDDTVLKENSIKLVYDKMKGDTTIGTLGYHLTFPDGSHQDSVRRYPGLLDQLLILTKLHNFFPKLKPVRKYLALDFDYTKEQEADQVMGACMIMPREDFEAVGGFDEHFFVWFEEVDLQKRIKEQRGKRIVYSPFTEMVHVKGGTFGRQLSLEKQRHLNRSMRYYFKKHHGVVAYLLLAVLHPYSIFLAWVVQVLRNSGMNINDYKRSQN